MIEGIENEGTAAAADFAVVKRQLLWRDLEAGLAIRAVRDLHSHPQCFLVPEMQVQPSSNTGSSRSNQAE